MDLSLIGFDKTNRRMIEIPYWNNPNIYENFSLIDLNQLIPNTGVAFEKLTIEQLVTNQHVRGGQTAFDTGTGFWLGVDGTVPKFSIGDSTGYKMYWDGTDFYLNANKTNLQLYDAVVDAAGFGDYTDIKTAVDAGEKNIFIRAGTYTLTADIAITADDTSFTGENWDDVIIAGNYTIDVDADRFSMRKVKKTGKGSGNYMVDINGDDAVIEYCRFEYTAGDCGVLYTTGDNRLKFLNNYINVQHTSGANYLLYIGSANAVVHNNIIISTIDVIIALADTNVSFDHNYVNATLPTINSTWVTSSGTGNTITDNYFLNSAVRASQAVSLGGNNGYFAGNAIYQAGVEMSSNNTKVIGNDIDTPLGPGIESASNASQCIIVGNVIKTATGAGIKIETTSGGAHVIDGNYIQDSSEQGMKIVDGLCVISNNRVFSCTGDGIFIDTPNTQVVGNFCEDNGGDGIEVNGAARDEVMMNSNVCRGNTGWGILWDNNPTSSTCVANLLKGNTAGNLSGAAGANSQFANNVTA